MIRSCVFAAAALLLAGPALAGPDDFKPGPAIPAFGNVANVPDAERLSKDAVFKIAFDTSVPAEPGKVNRTLESAARFLNMHEAVGIPASNIKLAVVVHGGASADLVAGQGNANAPLIAALLKHRVRIILCGQTAAYRDIKKADLVPGVEMALSAMTAHAQLQQTGYTLNPF
ncbi:DsrE family protein [Hyphomonas sp.]|jgi:intracellular sulfur oxidation DsrE/DsrF family protein|uniref:DsrE family protein n=1 Tax=Hyphomonas sp. TaxID=87 RepID=UPI0032D9A01E